MKWYHHVKAGDKVTPDPAWNRSERPPTQLPAQVEVIAVRREMSQTGTVFTVRLNNGQVRGLDADWFVCKA